MEEKPASSKGMGAVQALSLVWDVILSIAIPTILSALGGRWLDRRLGTTPIFLIIGLFCALGIVSILIVRKGKTISQDL